MIDLQASDLRSFVPAMDFSLSKDFDLALGFELEWADENLALFALANDRLYLQRHYAKEWAENCMLHVSVQDALDSFHKLTELVASRRFPGVRVMPPKDEPYGALVTYVWDPSGVLIHLAQWARPENI